MLAAASSGKTRSRALSDAVRDGHIEAVRLLLDEGIYLNRADSICGWTALHVALFGYAGRRGDRRLEIIRLLLQAGADPNAAVRYRRMTPLICAANHAMTGAVQLLLQAGADPNTADVSRSTALLCAAHGNSKHTGAVRLLLQAGADVNAANVNGQTPLMAAARNGHIEALRLLLEAGADVGAANAKGQTALMSAAQNGHLEAVRLLLEAGASAAGALPPERGKNCDAIAALLEQAGA